MKRIFDFSVALIAFPFMLIIMAIVAPIIKINDSGPVFIMPKEGVAWKTIRNVQISIYVCKFPGYKKF